MIHCFLLGIYTSKNGVSHTIIFLLRNPKKDSIKNAFVIFLGKFPNFDASVRKLYLSIKCLGLSRLSS